jgi:hypothetical protein
MTQPPHDPQSPRDPQPPRDALPPPANDADATDPSLALADVWDLLDVLPAAAASPDMMATTIEMAAVPAAAMMSRTGNATRTVSRATTSRDGRSAKAAAWPPVRQWLPGAALVLVSLVAGIAVGRATAPNTESAILASLPVVQHLDLLREAGSVAFLEAVAKGGYPPPRRPPPAQSKADVREDAEEFDAALAALRAAGEVTANRETLAARREQVLQMPDAQRRQLERSAGTFQRLNGTDRSDLIAVGRALADPGREQLLKAARLWHLWVQFRDPADRRDVIELSGEDRLEWLDRCTQIDSRQDPRQDGRDPMRPYFDRERDNRRRPPPDFRQGPPDFRHGPPPERWQGPPGPPRPRGPGPGMGPPVNDQEPPPAETQAPPR